MVALKEGFDPDLPNWADVKPRNNWNALLIGNGASRAVWERFAYPSLYDKATSADIANPLTEEDQGFFASLGNTRNFEAVLGALATARMVCRILGQDTRTIDERYASIRQALIQAVHSRHVPWRDVPQASLLHIGAELREYDYVFSTNYDLLVYWSMMAVGAGWFVDYFWGDRFRLSNTDVWRTNVTKILYLHGGLHIYRLPAGGTIKDQAELFENLLDRFGRRDDAVPLFITEGSSEQKLEAIARSDYLAFAFQAFVGCREPLVIFGQALGDTDRHIVDALRRWGQCSVAYGMLNLGAAAVVEQKARIQALLPEACLTFFDAATHPLGDPSLRINAGPDAAST